MEWNGLTDYLLTTDYNNIIIINNIVMLRFMYVFMDGYKWKYARGVGAGAIKTSEYFWFQWWICGLDWIDGLHMEEKSRRRRGVEKNGL